MASPDRPSDATRQKLIEFAESRDERLRDELVEAHLGLAFQLAWAGQPGSAGSNGGGDS